jgi:hypothetical protein
VDLEPGRYLVACFVPVGATQDAIESGKEPDGPPHALQGMVAEMQVRQLAPALRAFAACRGSSR